MKKTSVFIVGLQLFSMFALADLPPCKGGGGGVPFSNIAKTATHSTSILTTQSLLKSFVIWERTGMLNYVDEGNALLTQRLSDGKSTVIGIDSQKFSPILDPQERYLLSENGKSVFDTQGGRFWRKIPIPGNLWKHAFWKNGDLYSVARQSTNSEASEFSIYKYTPQNGAMTSCRIKSKFGFNFYLAEGHEYPFIYLYRQQRVGDEYDLHLFRVRVDQGISSQKCVVEDMHGYMDKMPGKILEMHRFSELEANIFVVDHPTKNLLWDRGSEECVFYNLENRIPMVLSHKLPLVALSNEKEGLSLLYPRNSKGFEIRDIAKFPLQRNHLQLSGAGDMLYVAQTPYADDVERRLLYRVPLDK